MDPREQHLISKLKQIEPASSKEIFDVLELDMSYATVKRLLSKLDADRKIEKKGRGKGTKYRVSPLFDLLQTINVDTYFKKEIDERKINASFNQELISSTLASHSVFSSEEIEKLNTLQKKFEQNITELNEVEFKNEFERLAIDLSWKSSQIEGNTYSLLETERLIKDKETAAGKTQEEATMLLNHKAALDFLLDHPDYLSPLSVSKIEDVHSILVKDLPIGRNLRKRRVGITGTNYSPLDNEFQIKEALALSCKVINGKQNPFEKALLALVLISYVQPFMDGNKRTARIVSNAILMNEKYCPLSFRTVNSLDYKKAMLLFYEQNNIAAFKTIFIDQFEFAVENYF